MNPTLPKDFAQRCAEHLDKAETKHPYFADILTPRGFTNIKSRLAEGTEYVRSNLKDNLANHRVGWDDLLNCEIWEVFEAIADNDDAHAIDECYDAIAVLMRTIKVLEGTQKLGKPEGGKGE